MSINLLNRNQAPVENSLDQDQFFADLESSMTMDRKESNIDPLKVAHIRKKTIHHKLWQILLYRQNRYLKESYMALKNSKALEGFSQQIPIVTQQCYSFFSQALSNSRNLKRLDMSGTDLYPLLAIEVGQGIQNNSSLTELNLSACRMNSFSLQYLFTSVSNHKHLQILNIFNNQGFSIDLMAELREFLFKGKNQIKKLKLTHCNIDPTSLSFLFRNMKHSKSLTYLDISMMQFNTEVLTSLGMGLQEFKGDRVLESLNIGGCLIKQTGLETLSERMSWSLSKIKINEIIMRNNKFTQMAVPSLQKWLKNIDQLQRLDLSNNELKELSCPELHARKLYEINLMKNEINQFTPNFFFNTLVVNLAHNKITSKGAFQLATILRSKPAWIELNLSNNQIQSEGLNALIFGLRDNQMLKKLVVANTGLDGESIICYMINHEQLSVEYLDISWNSIRYSLMFVMMNYLKHGCLRVLRAAYILDDLQMQRDDNFNMERSIMARIDTQDNQMKSSGQLPKRTKQAVFQITAQNLRELNFQGNPGILSPVVSSLATYFNKIETLDISSCKLESREDVEQLALFLSKTSTLHDLCLRDLKLGKLPKETFHIFAKGLGQNQSIIRLNVSKNYLCRQFKVFVDLGMKSYNLESLDLSSNSIENKSAKQLEKLIMSLRNLQDLNLSKNQIKFHGINAIINGVRYNKRLKSLNLSHQKFTADDLLMISELLNHADNLQSLNISNNLALFKVGSFFYQCSQEPQEVLSISDLYVDQFNFVNLQKIIQRQGKYLKGIHMASCVFQKGCFTILLQAIQGLRNLEYLHISNNPTMDKELGEMGDILSKIKKLKVFKIVQTTLNNAFIKKLSDWLENKQCQIIQLDLQNNYLIQDWLDILSKGIAMNQSLQFLSLSACSLGNLNLDKLGEAVNINQQVHNLDLSFNNIRNFRFITKACKATRQFSTLNLRGNQKIDHLELYEIFTGTTSTRDLDAETNQQLKVRYLDLSECNMTIDTFKTINRGLNVHGNAYGFYFIEILSLQGNGLGDELAQIIREILRKTINMRDVNLSKNNFSSSGAYEIFQGMVELNQIKVLNLGDNRLDDAFLVDIATHLSDDKPWSLEFFHIDGNKFSRCGINILVRILNHQEALFISNSWKHLEDSDTIIILKQYKRIREKYRISQVKLPTFLTHLSMTESNLTDEFCFILCQEFLHLDFVELIDLSDNPCITMYGKVYLFIHLFDPKFEKHELQYLYISDSHETRKLFDDGLLRYSLLKFRNFLYPPVLFGKQTQVADIKPSLLNHSIRKQGQVQKIIGGLCGAWILQKINQILAILDNHEPPQFIISTLLIGKFRVIEKRLWMLNLFTFFLIQVSYLLCTSPLWFIRQANKNIEQIPDLQEYKNSYEVVIYKEITVLMIIIIMLLGLIEVVVVMQLRKTLKPAFQIMSPQLVNYLQNPLPHKGEILEMIIGILLRIGNFLDFYTLSFMVMLTRFERACKTEEALLHYQQISVLVIFLYIFISSRIWINPFVQARYLYLSNKIKPSEDQAKFLTVLWKKYYTENLFVMSKFLSHLSPIGGTQVTKQVKIHFQITFEAIILFTSGFPMMAIMIKSTQWYFTFINQNYEGRDILEGGKAVLILCIIKEAFRNLLSIILIFTSRPSVIKQHEYNQALTIKKFHNNKRNFVRASQFELHYNPQQYEIVQRELIEWREKNQDIRNQRINVITERDNEDDDEDNKSSNQKSSANITPGEREEEYELEEKQINLIDKFDEEDKMSIVESYPSIADLSERERNDSVRPLPSFRSNFDKQFLYHI